MGAGLDHGMSNAKQDFEPIPHTVTPQVSIAFSYYFIGDERAIDDDRIEDFLDAMSEETIDELMVVDRQF